MNILFIAAEVTPLVKVGGLADVVGSLPKALSQLGHDVKIIMPRYGIIDIVKHRIVPVIENFDVQIGQSKISTALVTTELTDDVRVFLIDNDQFFGSDIIYGENELDRFLFFCQAIVQLLPELDWQPDIVHCHDWHTALIPLLLNRVGYPCSSIFTIHNLAYQGSFDSYFLSVHDLHSYWQHEPLHAPEPPLNFIGQGILWADMVTTVSENYAREIVTPEYGEGLDHLLRYRQDKLIGILNGIDYNEYNPATDSFIKANFSSTKLDVRMTNKLALQKQAGLPEDAGVPVIGMVSRLDEQKGLDILSEGLDVLFQHTEAQLVILGKGREHYHNVLQEAAGRYSQQLALFIEFNEALGHLIYAGCDMFLMPSRFEPCGLGQLVAMRYGAVPVVRHTGGLVDTVQDLAHDLSKGNGFTFEDYSADAMCASIHRALDAYRNKKVWQKVMQRIMALDFSWQRSAKKYEAIYQHILELKGYA